MTFKNIKIDDIWDKNFQDYIVSARPDTAFPYGFNSGDQNIYFLALNDPLNPRGGNQLIPASGFNFSIGSSGSLNFATKSLVTGITSMVIGGYGNVTRGNSSAVIGGCFNRVNSSNSSAIIGGQNNTLLRSNNSVILGGICNCMASGSNLFFMGVGECNYAQGDCSVLLGGICNSNQGTYAFLGVGLNNCIANFTTANTLVGGTSNIVNGNYNFLGGGSYNSIAYGALNTIIGGGLYNCAEGQGTAILGGFCNKINTAATDPTDNTIVGGFKNCINLPVAYPDNCNNFIGGGEQNFIGGCVYPGFLGRGPQVLGARVGNSIIVGGKYNFVSNTTNSSILGGCQNSVVNGSDSFVLGSCNTTTSTKSFIIGQKSYIDSDYSGAGIISDGTDRLKISQGPNTLTLDFISGTYIKNRTILETHSYVPSTYTSYGVSGQLSFDANYFYRHNGTNWTRTALSIW